MIAKKKMKQQALYHCDSMGNGKRSKRSTMTTSRFLLFVALIGFVTFMYASKTMNGTFASNAAMMNSSTLVRMAQSLENAENKGNQPSAARTSAGKVSSHYPHNDVLLDGLQTPDMHDKMMTSCPSSMRLNMPPNTKMTLSEFVEAVFDGLEQVQVQDDPLNYVVNNFDMLVMERGALPTGFWAEFGIFQGKTLKWCYERLLGNSATGNYKRVNKLFLGLVAGFDSFQGLPEKWRDYKQGYFTTPYNEVRSFVPSDVVLKKGWFQDTIGEFLVENAPRMPATMINHDGDLFVSTAITFSLANERIVPGTLICFDELFGYPGYMAHEILALFLWMRQVNATLCPLAVMSPMNRTHVSDNLMEKQAPAPKQGACFQVLNVGRS